MKDNTYWDSRHNPPKKASYTGVTEPRRKCVICGKYKPIPGSSQKKNAFTCKECKDANKP